MESSAPQHRTNRGVTFAPLAQNDTVETGDWDEPDDHVQQPWQHLTAKERFRSQIRQLVRHASAIEEEEERNDNDGQQFQQRVREAAYTPVSDLIPTPEFEERDIVEFSGQLEYYAPTYDRAPSSLSKNSDARTEITYIGSEPGDKFLHWAPNITTAEVCDEATQEKVPLDRPNYKPFVLKWTFLAALFLSVAVLLALTEVAVHVLPTATPDSSSQLKARTVMDQAPGSYFDSRQKYVLRNLLARKDNSTETGNGDSNSEPRITTTTLPSSTTSTSKTSTLEVTSSTTSSSTKSTIASIPSPDTSSPPETSFIETRTPSKTSVPSTAQTHSDEPEPSHPRPSRTRDTSTRESQGQGRTSDLPEFPGNPGPPSQVSTTEPASVTTSTTAQQPSSGGGQGPEPGRTSSTSSEWLPRPPGQGPGQPTKTCTVSVEQTHTIWFTIPILTVDLNLGRHRRTAQPVFTNELRQIPECATTVTVTKIVDVTVTTALKTVTISLGGGGSHTDPPASATRDNPGGPMSSFPPVTGESSTSSKTPFPIDNPQPSSGSSSLSISINLPNPPASSIPISIPTGLPQSSFSTIILSPTPDPPSSESKPPGGGPTIDTSIYTISTNVSETFHISVTVPDVTAGKPITKPATTTSTPAAIPPVVVVPGNPGASGQGPQPDQQTLPTGPKSPAEAAAPPPVVQKPQTTVIDVIEVHTVITTVRSTVTPTATNSDGAGAIFVTDLEVTDRPFVTRLQSFAVVKGVFTRTEDGTAITMIRTLSDQYGHPTATEIVTSYAYVETRYFTDSEGRPTSEVFRVLHEPAVKTYTDAQGRSRTKTYFEHELTLVITDSLGRATQTQTLHVTETPSAKTLFDKDGIPTETITEMVPDGTSTEMVVVTSTASVSYNASAAAAKQVIQPIPATAAQSFTSLLLPILLAAMLLMPVRILDQTTKLYQPFSALTTKFGARTQDSLSLRTTGLWGLISGVTEPLTGNWLLVVTGLLVLAGSALVAVSAEVIRLGAHESSECIRQKDGTLMVCSMSLSVVPGPAQVAVGLLGLMAMLVGMAAWGLWGRSTGTRNDAPWSLFEMGRLAAHPHVLALTRRLQPQTDGKIRRRDAVKEFGKRRFRLDFWREDNPKWDYGIIIANDGGQLLKERRTNTHKKGSHWGSRHKTMPLFLLGHWGRLIFVLLLLGLFLVVLLYGNSAGEYQYFMDKGSFGGRFFLTVVGVIVSFMWWTFFTCVAFISPYRLFYRTQDAVYLSPPSNPITGLWKSLRREHPDFYLGVVAFTAILSDILPVLLANVPYRAVSQGGSLSVCAWIAVGIICFMVLVVLWSFLIKWPHMPIDPTTIVGGMYYAMQFSSFRRRSPEGRKSSPV